MRIISWLRSFIMTLLYPVVLVSFSAWVLLLHFLFHNRRWEDYFVQMWGRVSCWMFGVKVKVTGMEWNPPGGCVYVFNHTSFFDIFAMQASIRGLRFGAKIELFKIPVFGYAMTQMGALPIARHKRDEVFKVYEAAEGRIHKGEKFALAPEGTRQEEEKLGPFKSGPFVFAINAKALLVPLVIRGAAAILPKGRWMPNSDVWTREVRLDILPPIPADTYNIKDRPLLQEKVRNEMATYFP